MKAMEFEGSTWESGGAAIFFQQGRNEYGATGDYCRVDREKIIFGNLDSSSGRSIKYQNTRCGDAPFYYRHAAGAADAANLHSGGRCVAEHNFTRLSLSAPGEVNLPGGELPEGWELPNHNCDGGGASPPFSCAEVIKINTINDAEACCQMCASLQWLSPNDPNVGGDASRDPVTGVHENPCLAWQIVEGRCRITRKSYFDHFNPGQTVLAAVMDDDYSAPGNTNWVIRHRGCGSSQERCNYNSWIYYREAGTSGSSSASSTFRRMAVQELDTQAERVDFSFSTTSLVSRRDARVNLISGAQGALRANTTVVGAAAGGTDCGLIEVFDASQALVTLGDYEVFNDEVSPTPLCTSSCISQGSTSLSCNLEALGSGSGRRLADVSRLLVSFTSQGSGYDTTNFEVTGSSVSASTTTTSMTTTTTTSTMPTTSTTYTAMTATTTMTETMTETMTGTMTETMTTYTSSSTSDRLVIRASFVLRVAHAEAWVSRADVSVAVAQGIAAALDGIEVDMVTILGITMGARRLHGRAALRRLQPGLVTVRFEIDAARTAAVAQITAEAIESSGASFQTQINDALEAASIVGADVMAITVVVGTTTTTGLPDGEDSGCLRLRGALGFLLAIAGVAVAW
jgi:hypothetical protein